MANPAYASRSYKQARSRLLAVEQVCAHCGRAATEADHQPPLSQHAHLDGTGCCRLVPSCPRCARRQGAILAGRIGTAPPARPAVSPAGASAALDAVGWPAGDPIWRRDWLAELVDVPDDATWPRLMTPTHPEATGSYGDEFAAYAAARSGMPLRWWQRLAAARLLEHDESGDLCWRAACLTVARQVGKSHLLRELCMWRLGQGHRFGGPQTIVHTGKDLGICVEVQRPARRWARSPDLAEVYKVREANGQEMIEALADGSRWMIRAKDNTYGLTASMTVVDEAWKVEAEHIDEGLVPTMIEQYASQLLLVSTGHRRATGLMVDRRNRFVADPASTTGALWIEWSAPPTAELGDEAAWRAASPHWHRRRRDGIVEEYAKALAGDGADEDETDPLEGFATQWLNRWPARRRRSGHGEPLLPEGVWERCAGALDDIAGAGVIALEENRGTGAAAAFVAADAAGRFEVDGRACATWAEAIDLAADFMNARPGARLYVGARMNNQLPDDFPARATARKAGQTETGRGLVLLRNLVAEGRVVHDETADLDDQLARARVHPLTGGGIGLVNNNARTDLLRACLWALDAAQAPAPIPAVH